MTKFGILTSGGGPRCAASAGYEEVLMRMIRDRCMDVHVRLGASGTSANAAYNVAGQTDDMRRIWREHVATMGLIRLDTYPIIGIDRLISIFQNSIPLDVQAVRESHTELAIAATCITDGSCHYFNNESDIYAALESSMGLPIVYQPEPRINVDNTQCSDSPISSRVEAHLARMVLEGVDKLLIIDVSKQGFTAEEMLFWMWMHATKTEEYAQGYAEFKLLQKQLPPEFTQKWVGHKLLHGDKGLPFEEVLLVRPPFVPGTFSESHYHAMYDAGESMARASSELREFLDR